MGQAVVKMNAGRVCNSNTWLLTVMRGFMTVQVLICMPCFLFKDVVVGAVGLSNWSLLTMLTQPLPSDSLGELQRYEGCVKLIVQHWG